MCVNCLRTQVDITEGMQKQATILWCKECGRYLQPPKHWLHAEAESKELLTFCLKKLKGLQKVRPSCDLYWDAIPSAEGCTLLEF
jgi:nonsense-mediated mRNA decay protein 3